MPVVRLGRVQSDRHGDGGDSAADMPVDGAADLRDARHLGSGQGRVRAERHRLGHRVRRRRRCVLLHGPFPGGHRAGEGEEEGFGVFGGELLNGGDGDLGCEMNAMSSLDDPGWLFASSIEVSGLRFMQEYSYGCIDVLTCSLFRIAGISTYF